MIPQFLIIMGVSGCGKTTLGRALAAQLGWPFYDADDFHSPANVAKMRAGIPLTDADRTPWLAALHTLMVTQRFGVLACSALKARYRQTLLADAVPAHLIYLKGSYATIAARLAERTGHYMSPTLLQSQFEALEEPTQALVVDVTMPTDLAVQHILHALGAVG